MALALLALAACKSGSKPAPSGSTRRTDAAVPAPALRDAAEPPRLYQLEPARAYDLPPPVAGTTRLDVFDVDIARGACEPQVSVPHPRGGAAGALGKPDVDLVSTVGTLRLHCGGRGVDRACLEQLCATMQPVPGGSATEAYPVEEPVVALAIAGGFAGLDHGGAEVFADGTVSFHGPGCPRWRGRRGQLTPAARYELMAAITASGVETYQESARDEQRRLGECSDDVYTTIVVGGAARTLGCRTVPAIAAAIAAVEVAIFPNPCDRP